MTVSVLVVLGFVRLIFGSRRWITRLIRRPRVRFMLMTVPPIVPGVHLFMVSFVRVGVSSVTLCVRFSPSALIVLPPIKARLIVVVLGARVVTIVISLRQRLISCVGSLLSLDWTTLPVTRCICVLLIVTMF